MTELLRGMWQYILTFNISIFDVLDVAIIAYIVYRVLMLVQRSRAAQVAKAILLLLVALGLSYLLQLRVINFVLSRMVEMGTLALVVVFQPEIRRFLEQLGSSRLGDMFSREEAPPDVENAITFQVDGMDCEDVGQALGEQGIAVRSGLHCAPLAHRSAGTLDVGPIRVSFSAFNSSGDVDALAGAVARLPRRQ